MKETQELKFKQKEKERERDRMRDVPLFSVGTHCT